MWYRVELNKDGTVAKCDVVESSFADSKNVLYIEADNKPDALKLAAERWRRIVRLLKLADIDPRAARPGLAVCRGLERVANGDVPGAVSELRKAARRA